jgi:photosystem II stability/assembly factor-like uncharacterized protein
LKSLLAVIVFFVILICPGFTSASGSFWISQQSPTSKNLRKCFFINSLTGWISGDSGIILKTTNSGINWNTQLTGISEDIQAVFFLNSNTGWALAWILKPDTSGFPGTVILKTTNGGDNWSRSMLADTNYYYDEVYFLNDQKGFLGGFPEFILYTINGGASWNSAGSDSMVTNGLPAHKILFINGQTGYACGGAQDFNGLVWKTTNGGLNWTTKVLGPDTVNDMYIFSEDTLFAVSGDFKFGANYFKSPDHGLNWENFDLGYLGRITAIDFRTKKEGWMTIGYQQKLFLSTDSGYNWTILDPPDDSQLFDIVFADSLNGWAVGANGAIYKYNLLADINYQNYSYKNDFNLQQNYPNPFNPKTIINYQLPKPGYILLRIYDVLGNEVATLVNEKQNPGKYKAEFDATNLPSGIYYYRITSDNFSLTRKMVLVK